MGFATSGQACLLMYLALVTNLSLALAPTPSSGNADIGFPAKPHTKQWSRGDGQFGAPRIGKSGLGSFSLVMCP